MTPVVAIFTAKPGSENQARELFLSLVAPTHQEEGCINYQVNQDINDSRKFVFTEVWTSVEALRKHQGAPHMLAFRDKIAPLVEGPAVVYVLNKLGGGDVQA